MKQKEIIRFIYAFPVIFLIIGLWFQDPFYYLVAFFAWCLSYAAIHPDILSHFMHMKQPKFHKPKSFYQKTNEVEIKLYFEATTVISSLLVLFYLLYLELFSFQISQKSGILPDFFIAFWTYLQKEWYVFILVLGIYGGALIFCHSFHKELSRRQVWVSSGMFLIISFLIIVPLSLCVAYGIGVGELNVVSLKSKTQIVSGRDAVTNKLDSFASDLRIVGNEKRIDNSIVYNALQPYGGRSSFYTGTILGSIPRFMNPFFSLPTDNMVLIGNYLLIREMEKPDLKAVTGRIMKLFMRGFMAEAYIKEPPKYDPVSRDEYKTFRDIQINNDIKTLDRYIASEEAKMTANNADISAAYTNIARLNRLISDLRNKVSDNTARINDSGARDRNYDACIKEGYWLYNVYYPKYSKQYCDIQKSSYDWNITVLKQENQDSNERIVKSQTEITEWNGKIQTLEQQNTQAKTAIAFFNQLQKLGEVKKTESSHEQGIFVPNESVKIVIENPSTQFLADYLEIATHEYLHYTSFVSQEKKDTFEPFFEEVLTELYARKLIKAHMGIDTYIGYPVGIKIIEEMLQKVNEKDFASIYMSKDQAQLEETLNKAYGAQFYPSIQTLVRQLLYTSGNAQLPLANTILQKIGGKQLQESDLLSVHSKVE